MNLSIIVNVTPRVDEKKNKKMVIIALGVCKMRAVCMGDTDQVGCTFKNPR
jgi:hypothetical protein